MTPDLLTTSQSEQADNSTEDSIKPDEKDPGPARWSLKRRPRLSTVLIVALLIVYGALLARYAAYSVSGSDSTGYALLARSIVRGKIAEPVPELNQLGLTNDFTPAFLPLGYLVGREPGTMAPLYPIGLPLHMAAGAIVGGWKYGPYLVNPIAGVVSLILLYLIGLELGLPRRFSVIAAMLLAVSPTFVAYMLQSMSDGTAAFWAIVVVWASLRSRKRDARGMLAGAAFGMALLVRPTNILLLVPILFSLRLRPKALFYFCLGGLPLALIFFAYNTVVFGHPLQTGYGTISLYNEFKMSGFTVRFNHYFYWMSMLMGPLVFLGWFGSAACRSVYWRDRALLISWFAAFLIFYSFYDIYNEWWYTRFLLPGIPAVILGATLTTKSLIDLLQPLFSEQNRVKVEWILIAVMIVVTFGFSRHYIQRFYILKLGGGIGEHLESINWADKILPDRSLVISMEMSSTLKFYTTRSIARYDLISPDQWQRLKARVAEKGYHLYALLMTHEIELAKGHLPGHWKQIGTYKKGFSLWQVEPDP